MKRALMLASVASMIDQFNMDNIKLLQNMGYNVDVVTNFEYGSTTSQERVNEVRGRLENDGVHTIHMPIPREITDIKGIVRSYGDVKKLCDGNKYDIMHCHSPMGSVIARLSARNARKKYNTKVIYTAHGFHFYKGAPIKNQLTFFPIEWLCSFLTDTLITINKEDYENGKRLLHAKRVEYVPGVGIDTEGIRDIKVNRAEKLKEFGITNETVLISVGELNTNKNHEVIIKALAGIDTPFKYLLCGKGDKEKYLKELARKGGIGDKVIFTGYRTDVKELLHCADVFLFPSFREGLSVALMEAMAAGLPAVCSRIRGNTDLIRDRENGFLCQADSEEEFCTAIKLLCSDKSMRTEMSEKTLEIIKKFDKGLVLEKIERIYASV